MNINLHIERLVLDGVNSALGQQHLLQNSVTSELTRLLNDGGLAHTFSEGVDIPWLATSGIQLAANKPAELGPQIAQSVYGGIARE